MSTAGEDFYTDIKATQSGASKAGGRLILPMQCQCQSYLPSEVVRQNIHQQADKQDMINASKNYTTPNIVILI